MIIAFAGLAGSGKSTAAMHLVLRHGFKRIRFADPLKNMIRVLGLTDAEIEGDKKEQPCALLCGKTPRAGMQTLGTEWGRDLMGSELWVRAWRHAVDKLPPYTDIVVDDCRFPNEVEAVRAAGGWIIRVVRNGAGQGAAGHSSEAQAFEVDSTIYNDGSIEDFLRAVDVVWRS